MHSVHICIKASENPVGNKPRDGRSRGKVAGRELSRGARRVSVLTAL